MGQALLTGLCDLPYLPEHPRVVMDRAYGQGEWLADPLELGYRPCVRLRNAEPEPIPQYQRRTRRVDHLQKRRQKVRAARARNTVGPQPGATRQGTLRSDARDGPGPVRTAPHGKFPGTCTPLFSPEVIQAQHIDTEYYDKHFQPGDDGGAHELEPEPQVVWPPPGRRHAY